MLPTPPRSRWHVAVGGGGVEGGVWRPFPRRFSTCQAARGAHPARPDSLSPQLAARIAVASLHKTTSDSFTATCVRGARANTPVRSSTPAARPRPLTPPRLYGCAPHSIQVLYDYVNPRSGLRAPLIAEDVYKVRRRASTPPLPAPP